METRKINIKEGNLSIILAPLSEFVESSLGVRCWDESIPCEFDPKNLKVFARTDVYGPSAEIYPFYLQTILEEEGISSESVSSIWNSIRADVQC